jgi:hypothetical protein
MRRKTKAIIVGTVTGSVVIVGSRFALAASDEARHEHVKQAAHPSQCDSGDDERVAATHRISGTSQGEDGREDDRRCRPSVHPSHGHKSPAPAPSTSVKPPVPTPSASTPVVPPPTASTPPAPSPSPSATAACASYTGSTANTAAPGSGTVTVTIKVCNGAITTATAKQVDNSGYSVNAQAIPALNTLAVQYYKTDITKIHYSGATLTSNAYQTSLRSAMAVAGI